MTDMMANLRAAGLREVIDYLDRLKAILVGTDAGSLPNDYTLIQIAEARMADLRAALASLPNSPGGVEERNAVIEECASVCDTAVEYAAQLDETDVSKGALSMAADLAAKIRALSAPIAAGDGWKLVPTEPTSEQRDAAEKCDWPNRNIYGEFDPAELRWAGREIYRAMLSAAPALPSEGKTR